MHLPVFVGERPVERDDILLSSNPDCLGHGRVHAQRFADDCFGGNPHVAVQLDETARGRKGAAEALGRAAARPSPAT